jgi:hypothetical protein
MNKRHPGADHIVRAVCADFMALQNHGLVFGGRQRTSRQPPRSRRDALQ